MWTLPPATQLLGCPKGKGFAFCSLSFEFCWWVHLSCSRCHNHLPSYVPDIRTQTMWPSSVNWRPVAFRNPLDLQHPAFLVTWTRTGYVGNPLTLPEESRLLPGPVLASYFLCYGKEITRFNQVQEKVSLDPSENLHLTHLRRMMACSRFSPNAF